MCCSDAFSLYYIKKILNAEGVRIICFFIIVIKKKGAFVFGLFLCFMASSAQAQVSANYYDGGAIRVGPSATTCDSNSVGGLRWSSVNSTFEMCDGSEWRMIVASTGSGSPPQPDPNVGYFVLSASTRNGNFGGLSGANSLCLTELTNNDWAGKTDAQARGILIAAKVKAWLCTVSSCNDLNPLQTYQFAVAGDNTMGGATITMNASGVGPGNTQIWSAQNYLGSSQYWTGRATGTSTAWGSSTNSEWVNCASYGTSSGSWTGNIGASGNTDSKRWNTVSANCSVAYNFICIVNP